MSKLGIRSGKLYQSFMLNGTDTLTKINRVDGNGISVTIGSKNPYAEIQNESGFIKASPVTVIRTYDGTQKNKVGKLTRFETFQMARYFWALYFETSEKKWMYTALKVHKQGGMKVEATHYFDKAVDDFKKTHETDMLNDLRIGMEKLIVNDEKNNFENVVKQTTKTLRNFSTMIPNYFLISLSDNMELKGKPKPHFAKKPEFIQ